MTDLANFNRLMTEMSDNFQNIIAQTLELKSTQEIGVFFQEAVIVQNQMILLILGQILDNTFPRSTT